MADDTAGLDQGLNEIQHRLTGLAFDRRDPKLSKIADELRALLSQANAEDSMSKKTLRDEFAIAALTTLISHATPKLRTDADACAASAYDFADTMIRARRPAISETDRKPDLEFEHQRLAPA